MGRLMHFLFVLAFAATSAVATPFAVCQHADAKAHSVALASSDTAEAMVAQLEDSADSVAKKQGSTADTAGGALAPAMLPRGAWMAPRMASLSIGWFGDAPTSLIGRASPPLLDPPLN